MLDLSAPPRFERIRLVEEKASRSKLEVPRLNLDVRVLVRKTWVIELETCPLEVEIPLLDANVALLRLEVQSISTIGPRDADDDLRERLAKRREIEPVRAR